MCFIINDLLSQKGSSRCIIERTDAITRQSDFVIVRSDMNEKFSLRYGVDEIKNI